MATIDLRAPSITIKFDKGKTLNPIFFYLDKNNAVIDISAYSARMQAKLNVTDTTAVWDFNTGLLGGLDIVQGTATLENGTTVANAWGVQILATAVLTAALATDIPLYFDIELIDTALTVLPFMKGVLLPSAEITITV
jgi:hypothetical protein